MKAQLLVIGLVLILGIGLVAQTATPPALGNGTSGSPYQIATLDNLYWINQNPDEWPKYYIQTADIDATETSGWDDGAGWTPIGDSFAKFSGSYNGQGHTIGSLCINRSPSNYQGLFGNTNGATIQNLGVASVNIKGQTYVGGLVGYAKSTTVSNCYCTGSVSGSAGVGGLVGYAVSSSNVSNCYCTSSVSGTNGDFGGLVGDVYSSTISDCYSTGNVSGQGGWVGGLVGYAESSPVSDCHSTGTVSGTNIYVGGLVGDANASSPVSNCYSTGTVSGAESVGGLVGINASSTVSNSSHSTGLVSGTGNNVGGLIGKNDYSSTVSNCNSTSSVTGTQYTGGLVGYNNSSTVSKCYSSGSVSGTAGVGGLVGWNMTSSTLSNSYSRGDVTRSSGGQTYFGGFVGGNEATIQYCYSTGNVNCGSSTTKGFVGYNNGGSYTSNFWDEEASNQSTATGATAKNTAEMKTTSTFTSAGWDFTNVWGIVGSNYPTFDPDHSLPVGLVSFSAQTDGHSVALSWITESEVDNLGYILERSVEDGNWVQVASYQTNNALKGQGNTSNRTEYAFTDANVETGKAYSYRLSDVSTQGEITAYASLSIKVDNPPETTAMENAYPNPFNPQTYIAYHLAEGSDVKITAFDLLGRSVKELYSGHQYAGSYHVYWNGSYENGAKAPSGNYIIRMQTENNTQAQKVTFMK
jgi:hypothetical protein